MHPHKPEFDLSGLRRQLEEILAMVNAGRNGVFARSADPESAIFDDQPETESARETVPSETVHPEAGQPDDRDDLYDDALVVVTEFGQATAAILQMWLSIDYGRAMTILNRFEVDGLISSKGKVRHKAFSLRRVIKQQT